VVVVKIVHEHLGADEEFRRHFKRQSLAAAAVEHESIVGVIEYNEDQLDDGRVHRYVVTEYVEARPLADVLEERWRMDSADGARLLRDLAAGLDAAHSAGLVHGRLHTRNVLVDSDGRAHITDFGTDIGGSDPLALIPRGASAGVSPEQLAGDEVTASSDIYTVGAIGFEALAGVALFASAEPSDVREGHLRDAPPPLPETVDDTVAKAVKRCLAKQPAQRFRGAAALAEVVSKALYDIENPRALLPVSGAVRSVVWQKARPTPRGRTGPSTVVEGRLVPREPEPVPRKRKRLWLLGAAALAAAIVAAAIFVLPGVITPPEGGDAIAGNAANKMDEESNDGSDPDGPGSADGSHSGDSSSDGKSKSDSDSSSSGSHNPSHHSSSHSSSHSSPPTEVKVPSVLGLTRETAESTLRDKGFDVSVSYDGRGHTECKVTDQNPDADEMAKKGSTVTITVQKANKPEDCDGHHASASP
jgi:serine/threonine-protein kinase